MKTVIALIANDKESWTEDFQMPDAENPFTWVNNLVQEFNDTLRPGERVRKLIRVRTKLPNGYPVPHEWEKASIVTEEANGRTFDRYRCKICGITGKRFGLGGTIVKDKRYNKEKHRMCKYVK